MAVLAYHLVVTTYGFWLPNDPRGSWSRFVRSFELYRAAGPATKTQLRRSLAGDPHDHAARHAAKRHLRYPPVRLTGEQARAATCGIASEAGRARLPIRAFAILPDHFHLVLDRTCEPGEQIARRLKAAATRQLVADGLHPLAGFGGKDGRLPTPWARNAWVVYLSSHAATDRAVAYVNANPIQAGLKAQHWSFVLHPPDRAERSAAK